MKILLLCEASWTVVSFRKELIDFLNGHGHEVTVIMGDKDKIDDVSSFCHDVHVVPFVNRGINPLKLIQLKKGLKKEIKLINPDVVLTFFIKPNTVGVKAAKAAHINKIYPFVEGLGDPFQPHSFKGKLIKSACVYLYKSSFKYATNVFFLNNDDRGFFIKEKIIKEEKTTLIKGIGIDTTRFLPAPLPKENNVLLIARLLKNKGIIDYCEAARIVRKTIPDAKFYLIGKEVEYTTNDLKQYIDDGTIIYDGVQNDVKKYICNSKVVVLPSYREGVPRSLLEAIASGRPVIGYDSVGVREVIYNNKNGYLVERLNIKEFAKAIIKVLSDDKLAQEFAINARDIAVNIFDSNIINNQILNTIQK